MRLLAGLSRGRPECWLPLAVRRAAEDGPELQGRSCEWPQEHPPSWSAGTGAPVHDGCGHPRLGSGVDTPSCVQTPSTVCVFQTSRAEAGHTAQEGFLARNQEQGPWEWLSHAWIPGPILFLAGENSCLAGNTDWDDPRSPRFPKTPDRGRADKNQTLRGRPTVRREEPS